MKQELTIENVCQNVLKHFLKKLNGRVEEGI